MSFSVKIFRWLITATISLGCLASVFAQTTTKTTTKVAVEVSTNIVTVIGEGKVDWTKEEIRARGIGIAPKYAKTAGQITALAREAAIVAAERNLLKVINGVQIISETKVVDLVLASDIIKTRVSGLLRGAVIVSEKPFGEDGYEIVLAVNLCGGKVSLSQSIDLSAQFIDINPETIVSPEETIVEPTPDPVVEPIKEPVPPKTPPNGYSGLVIDCRGLGLTASMCPRILDQSDENLWAMLEVSAEVINSRGIAGYFQSLDDKLIGDRVGKNPLVVKALSVSGGKVFKTNAVLATAIAELVRTENKKTLFLENLNVAFLTGN